MTAFIVTAFVLTWIIQSMLYVGGKILLEATKQHKKAIEALNDDVDYLLSEVKKFLECSKDLKQK